jgi:hypothetical protein
MKLGQIWGKSFLGDQDINVHESLLGLTKKFSWIRGPRFMSHYKKVFEKSLEQIFMNFF